MIEKRISRTIYLTEEENKKVLKKMFKLAEETGKMKSFSDTIRFMVNEYLNNNEPPSKTPAKEVSKEPSFDDIQVDF